MSKGGGRLEAALARWPAWTWIAVAAVSLGFAWRLWLTPRYFGWEESDYGNLAMARGVLDSHFTSYDMNHLPGFYAASALVLAVVGDAVIATHAVCMFSGLVILVCVVLLAWRLGGARAAWLAGALVVIQPELALYSASSLREPLYTALLIAALTFAGSERLGIAAVFGCLTFLTRMDALMVLFPVLGVHALGARPRVRRLAWVALPAVVSVAAWALYCRLVHGTARFWEHSVAVNLETGLGEEAVSRAEWLGNGLSVAWALATRVLPTHMGVALALAALGGLALLRWREHGQARTLGVAMLLLTGFWLGIALTAQHEPGHNLYWKWMFQLVPVWAVAAGLGLACFHGWLERRLGRGAAWVPMAVILASVWWQQAVETRRQIAVSRELYAPQLALAKEIETEIPEDWPMIVDNIPGCWINRRHHARRLWTWMDVPVPEGREGFGRWLVGEDIRRVLWFREEWTQAPVVAPWLGSGGVVELGGVRVRELSREEGYGWIWYEVDGGSHQD